MRLIIAILLTSISTSASAHHGLDYLLLQDGTAPARWRLSSFTAADLSSTDGFDEYNIESGLLLGLGGGAGIGVGFGIMDGGSSDWRYSSTTPYLNLDYAVR
jgi:hypothetical protein